MVSAFQTTLNIVLNCKSVMDVWLCWMQDLAAKLFGTLWQNLFGFFTWSGFLVLQQVWWLLQFFSTFMLIPLSPTLTFYHLILQVSNCRLTTAIPLLPLQRNGHFSWYEVIPYSLFLLSCPTRCGTDMWWHCSHPELCMAYECYIFE